MELGLHTPTAQEIKAARDAYEANLPRDLFYRAATELVKLAVCGQTLLTIAETVAVLLQTWNQAYYRFHKFSSEHFADIESLIDRHKEAVLSFRQRALETFADGDEAAVVELFQDFETVLGPVGAAKCLHLLAPAFFPLWDRAIAESYGLSLQRSGTNGSEYCRFMRITRAQCHSLGGEWAIEHNSLKALDEYNYCKYTKRWI